MSNKMVNVRELLEAAGILNERISRMNLSTEKFRAKGTNIKNDNGISLSSKRYRQRQEIRIQRTKGKKGYEYNVYLAIKNPNLPDKHYGALVELKELFHMDQSQFDHMMSDLREQMRRPGVHY